MPSTLISKLALAGSILAFCVVVLGAYVRLSDAGLGCPDWPGCYGYSVVPSVGAPLVAHVSSFDSAKAWKEMVHRYFAGTLAMLILLIAFLSVRRKFKTGESCVLSLFLLGAVLFQAALGMWTVTLKVHPVIVTSHLLGGFTTLALVWWMYLRESKDYGHHKKVNDQWSMLHSLALISLCMLILQIILGGWVSTNYAALACADFPTCNSSWWPAMDIKVALTPLWDFSVNYEGGILSPEARIAVHMLHRLGALITFLVLTTLAVSLIMQGKRGSLFRLGCLLLFLVCLQVGLGISNVLFIRPLLIATAHNGVASLLLLTLMAIFLFLKRTKK